MDTAAQGPHWLMTLLLVDSWMGVALAVFGLAAQAVFMSRMMVQWIASERAKRSVVPVSFWWLSVAGAGMLLAYGVMRQDVVIILAQLFGFVVYVRNLMLIYREKSDGDEEVDVEGVDVESLDADGLDAPGRSAATSSRG